MSTAQNSTDTPALQRDFRLLGLLDATILPGEQAHIAESALDERDFAWLKTEGAGARVIAVGIASRVEVPMLLVGRWATVCDVVEVAEAAVVLRGLERVKIAKTSGNLPPYQAQANRPEPEADADKPREIARRIARVFAAIAAGGEPATPDWPQQLERLLANILRAFGRPADARHLLAEGGPAALDALAEDIAGQAQARQAVDELEAALLKVVQTPSTDRNMRAKLWAQVVAIQKRLDVYEPMGEQKVDDELGDLQRRLSQAGLPVHARRLAKRELRMLRGMKKTHHDYSVHLRYLEFMARLPWQPEPREIPALAAVKAAMDTEHSGLARPKRRILEYLAVRRMGGNRAGLVLCLVGPPGVGKTSLVRSIASALGRPFVRVALGGVHEESELRGHRLSYVAAAPGRILDGVARAESRQALMLLDELDKVSVARQRSPAAALLEVLDPEQNHEFRDNYLACGFDLSDLLFIATANDASNIPPALRDRLEIIELEGYTTREKLAIAREHLLAELAKEHGFEQPLELDDALITHLIESYTREAGVRELRRVLASVHRARALHLVMGEADGLAEDDHDGLAELSQEAIAKLLGPPRYRVRERLAHLPVGVASGLSVGGHGGALLFVEVARVPGDAKLHLTGKQGEVMQEAARTALALLRSKPTRFGLEPEDLAHDFHIHLPEAAIAKEGPSAGIATLAALVSACRGVALRADVAMTGELTLTGRVLPVGGVRAKLLAAERAQMRRVLLPLLNQADIPEDYSVEVVLIDTVEDALQAVFDDAE